MHHNLRRVPYYQELLRLLVEILKANVLAPSMREKVIDALENAGWTYE